MTNETMTEEARCSECGSPIAADAPEVCDDCTEVLKALNIGGNVRRFFGVEGESE